MLALDLPEDQRQPMPQVYQEGKYTLQQVPEATQKAIISLRGAGYTIQEVAQTLEVHNKTVMAVDRYRPTEIARRKETTAAMMLDTADLAAGAVRDRLSNPLKLEKEKVKDLALTAAIMTDKGLQLAGESTHKVTVTFENPGHATYLEELARMGLGAAAPAPKGTAAAADQAQPIEAGAVEISEPPFTPNTQQGAARDA